MCVFRLNPRQKAERVFIKHFALASYLMENLNLNAWSTRAKNFAQPLAMAFFLCS
jgi:type VI protein secretion system component VasF